MGKGFERIVGMWTESGAVSSRFSGSDSRSAIEGLHDKACNASGCTVTANLTNNAEISRRCSTGSIKLCCGVFLKPTMNRYAPSSISDRAATATAAAFHQNRGGTLSSLLRMAFPQNGFSLHGSAMEPQFLLP